MDAPIQTSTFPPPWKIPAFMKPCHNHFGITFKSASAQQWICTSFVPTPPSHEEKRFSLRGACRLGTRLHVLCHTFCVLWPFTNSKFERILNTNRTPTGMKAISQVIFNNKQLHPLAAMHFQWTVNTNRKHLPPFNFTVVSTGSHDLPGTMEGLYNYSLRILYNILATWKHSGNSRSG